MIGAHFPLSTPYFPWLGQCAGLQARVRKALIKTMPVMRLDLQGDMFTGRERDIAEGHEMAHLHR